MAYDIMSGFQIGQQLAGPNALGIAIQQVLGRVNQLQQAKMENQFRLQQIGAEAKARAQYAGVEAEAKARAEAQYDPEKQFLSRILGTSQPGATGVSPFQQIEEFQKQLPQGSSLKIGPMTTSNPTPPGNIQQQQLANQNQLKMVDDLEQLAKQTGIGQQTGFLSQLIQGKGSQYSGGRTNQNLRLYMDQANASAAGIYRALTGDTRLSDRDAGERAKPLLWRPELGEPLSLGLKKFARLRKAFAERTGGADVSSADDLSQYSDEQLQAIAGQ